MSERPEGARSFVERCRRMILRPFDRSLPSLEDYLAETLSLGLSESGGTDEYVRSLGTVLGVEIEVIQADEKAHEDLEARLGRTPRIAEMLYDAEADRALIYIPSHVCEDSFLYFKSLYHELSHLAAGHPIPVADSSGELWWPPRRLARRAPDSDLDRNEDEANLRAEWSLMLGVMGRKMYDRDGNFSAF
jgi:DNA-binding transcriptional LysR family regulator